MPVKPGGFHVHTRGFDFARTGYSRVGTPRHPERWEGVPGEMGQDSASPEKRPIGKALVLPPALQHDAEVASAAPRIPWDEFLTKHFVWKRFDDEGQPSGEHVALVGPTGQGKTTLIFNLLPLHPFSAVFGTKRTDASLQKFVNSGFVRLEQWEDIPALQMPRRMVWPQGTSLQNLVPLQRRVFTDAIEAIYYEGFWDLVIDEGYYIDEVLKMGSLLRLIYTQIRSAGVSIVLATQRPAWVPVEVYDQSTHLFFWRDNDARNLSRLSELSVSHSGILRKIIPNLEPHQVLYLNTRTGFMCRTRSPKITVPVGR